uniref:Uncharacterized protein n=1 Tax=Chromera velia CCMP2878 TaxID=1169474 RepID=A0A0G4FXH7_9ALVE|eukprot:Cvel_19161.t1-p1 / transcript=Cvel_19161.t1 / gene=Cvel_19161 / organism=Chromera_velia_CCMP2878 / gene_product=hypothetical protein / transcript_product=hypothetical protein / location=Cvel_scaffold1632:8858-11881(+) / protein_length=276 / sequence_SO=supercontig / SO=protein_coding / is_pseudo=false
MSKCKDTFGLAWLTLCCVKKNVVRMPFEVLDFSSGDALKFLFDDFLRNAQRLPAEKIEIRLRKAELSADHATSLCEGQIPFSQNLILRPIREACVPLLKSCQTKEGTMPLGGLHLNFDDISFFDLCFLLHHGQKQESLFPEAIRGCLLSVSFSRPHFHSPVTTQQGDIETKFLQRWALFANLHFNRLTMLEIWQANNRMLQDLARSVASGRLPSLERLTVKEAKVGREGMESLFGQGGPGLPKVQHLDMSRNGYFSDGWEGTEALMRGLGAGRLPY